LLQIVLILAVSLLTAALHVRFRDLAPVVTLGLQLWLYLTPVAYPLERVPEQWRRLYDLNPMVGIVEAYRAVLAHGQMPDWPLLGLSALISGLALVVAYTYFKRAERSFADVI
jgi:lipopolysaccharide transport system permease protein